MRASDITSNYSHDSVPDDQTVSGIRIALVIIGIAITLPAFLLGAKIIVALGFIRGSLAIVAGGLIIAAVGMLTMTVGATSRLSTYLIIQFPFGRTGGRWVSLFLSITLLGLRGLVWV